MAKSPTKKDDKPITDVDKIFTAEERAGTTDADVLVGAPDGSSLGEPEGEPTQPTQPAEPPAGEEPPSKVKMMVGEVEVEVSADIAALVQSQQAQIDALRDQNATPPAAPEPVEDEPATLNFFDDPDAAIAKMTQTILSAVDEKIGAAREEVTVETRRQQYWGEFYDKNPELKGFDQIVNAVTQSNWDSLKALPTASSQVRIAKLAQDELLKIANTFKGNNPGGDQVVVEGGGNSPPAPVATDTGDDDKVTTISDLVRRKKAARMQTS